MRACATNEPPGTMNDTPKPQGADLPLRPGSAIPAQPSPEELAASGLSRDGSEAGTDVRARGDAVLRVTGVEKRFHRGIWPRGRSIAVLQGVTFDVRAGELVGLVGENGSGKSTLMQIIVGLLRADAGVVEPPARFGYCPQQPMLWDKLTVDEHFQLFGGAYGLDDDGRERAVTDLLEELLFAKYRHYRVEELSGGTRQKLNLALALLHDPDLLLLDEPYAGFDWETYLRFWEMSERRGDAGMGILVVSHLLTERGRLDRMYELREGRTVAQ
jgi:ABC-2 type transport system ATP-binding protein